MSTTDIHQPLMDLKNLPENTVISLEEQQKRTDSVSFFYVSSKRNKLNWIGLFPINSESPKVFLHPDTLVHVHLEFKRSEL